MHIAGLLTCMLLLAGGLHAQTTRAEEIEAERLRKAAEIRPERLNGLHRMFVWFEDKRVPQRVMGGVHGFRASFGTLGPASGSALGIEYFRPDLAKGEVSLQAGAAGSFDGFRAFMTNLTFPKLGAGKYRLDLLGLSEYGARFSYYGQGPGSNIAGRTIYSFENTRLMMELGTRPASWLDIGLQGGYSLLKAGPGNTSRFANAVDVFPSSMLPGMFEQPNYALVGAFIQANHGGEKGGGSYRVGVTNNIQTTPGNMTFTRIDADVQHFVPLLNATRIFALRARTSLTGTPKGNVIPLYLQPRLGGPFDMRGFRALRFYDNNSMVFNAEYQWELTGNVYGALFVDAGKVFPKPGMLNFSNLERSIGFGLRIFRGHTALARIDLGFSREGAQVWFTVEGPF
ncbi:MAG: BamA/TamA family outer membrane protein [Bryobacteraceae bacterium]